MACFRIAGIYFVRRKEVSSGEPQRVASPERELAGEINLAEINVRLFVIGFYPRYFFEILDCLHQSSLAPVNIRELVCINIDRIRQYRFFVELDGGGSVACHILTPCERKQGIPLLLARLVARVEVLFGLGPVVVSYIVAHKVDVRIDAFRIGFERLFVMMQGLFVIAEEFLYLAHTVVYNGLPVINPQ